jgi:SPP1 family predicted phage head-tail adaptor
MPGIVPSGMLRNAIVLQAVTQNVDSFGQATTTFTDVATLWGHVDAARSAETMYEGGIATRADYTFLLSWYPGVTTAHRLKWLDGSSSGRIFNIRAVWDRDQRQRRLQVEGTEIVP